MNLFFLLTPTVVFSQPTYYWADGEKIYLEEVPNKKRLLIKSNDLDKVESKFRVANVREPVKSSSFINEYKPGLQKVHTTENLRWVTVESGDISTIKADVIYEAPFYSVGEGREMQLSQNLNVELKDQADLSKLEKLASENNVTIVGNNEFMPQFYTVECTAKSKGNAIEVANLFYETGLFASSQPEFIGIGFIDCVNDPYYSYQWNLQGGINPGVNYCNTREDTQGMPYVSVAVIDMGLVEHPDLPNLSSYFIDIMTGNTTVRKAYGDHGMMCAGIIGAAANNGRGIAGIASGCSLVGVSINFDTATGQHFADAINYARLRADVLSCSWSLGGNSAVVNAALNAALTQSRRDNIGCVVVFSSGNQGKNSPNYPASQHDNHLVVGSISESSLKAPTSNYGTKLDLVAPGVEIYSTNLTGYRSGSGTSFAAPHVAATAALLLSCNNTLSGFAVNNVIEQTTYKMSPSTYSYTTTSGRHMGTWNNQVGYGLLDIHKALDLVKNVGIKLEGVSIVVPMVFNVYRAELKNVDIYHLGSLNLQNVKEVTLNYPFSVEGAELEINPLNQ